MDPSTPRSKSRVRSGHVALSARAPPPSSWGSPNVPSPGSLFPASRCLTLLIVRLQDHTRRDAGIRVVGSLLPTTLLCRDKLLGLVHSHVPIPFVVSTCLPHADRKDRHLHAQQHLGKFVHVFPSSAIQKVPKRVVGHNEVWFVPPDAGKLKRRVRFPQVPRQSPAMGVTPCIIRLDCSPVSYPGRTMRGQM